MRNVEPRILEYKTLADVVNEMEQKTRVALEIIAHRGWPVRTRCIITAAPLERMYELGTRWRETYLSGECALG